MKELNLPITTTYSTIIDLLNISSDQVVDLGDGKKALQLGAFIAGEYEEVVSLARRNGGHVLYAATSIEQEIEKILLNYFMGPFTGPDKRRDLFTNEVLQSSTLSFKSKKELLFKVINETDSLTGKRKDKLQVHLKNIMEWRNAFAHGKIQHDSTKGCLVKHYSGNTKELILSDDLLDEIEKTFHECHDLLNLVLRQLLGDT